MLSKGIPLKTTADRLGYAPLMILSMYGHSSKNLEIKLAKAYNDAVTLLIDGIFGGSF